jgi:uncharacterized membrane protein YfcA
MISQYMLFFIIFITFIQSVVGIGVLVLGTPILLFFNFSIIEAMNFLLPISLITSFLNLLILHYKGDKVNLNIKTFNIFFFIIIPFTTIGLFLLNYTKEFINFDFFVSILIILIIIFKKKIAIKVQSLSSKINKFLFILIAIVHGMTNSGGTLLSIVLSSINKSYNESRKSITIFYFFLALIQLILFYLVFGLSTYDYKQTLIYVVVGVILGNLFLKSISTSLFNKLIYILALISATSLFLKNII